MSRGKDYREAQVQFQRLRSRLQNPTDHAQAAPQIIAAFGRILTVFETAKPECAVEGDINANNGLPELAAVKFVDVLLKIEPTIAGVLGKDDEHRQLIDRFVFKRGSVEVLPSPLRREEVRGLRTMNFMAAVGFDDMMTDQDWATHIIGVLAGLIYADKPAKSKEPLLRAVGSGDQRAASEAYITVCTACLNDRWWRATYGEPVVPYSYLAAVRASMDPDVFVAASELVQKCIHRQQGVLQSVVG